MSHEIRYAEYPNAVSRTKVQKMWNNYAAMEDWQEGCSGVNPIRWIESTVLKSREEAENWIKAHDRKWYDCLAVRYKEGRKMTWLVKIEYHV